MKQYYAIKCSRGKESMLLPHEKGIYATTNIEALQEFLKGLKKEVKFVKFEIVRIEYYDN